MEEHGWFAVAVDQVVVAGQRACQAIERAIGELEVGRDAHLGGSALAEVVGELIGGGGRETRLGAAEAFRDYERAIASMRAAVVRVLVEDEGLSLSDVAKRLRISRQAAGRLYRSQEPDPGDEDPGLL